MRETVKRIGYEQHGFHWQYADFACHLHGQSADIAQGVDEAGNKDEGAGDQGIMFGFACDETPDLMPATIHYSHRILEKLAEHRHSGTADFLEPDSKSQVTLAYEKGKPMRAVKLVVSTQHAKGFDQARLRDYVKGVFADVLPSGWMPNDDDAIFVNPTGLFEIGGPDGDAGLTGRKIIVDTYGGAAPAWRRRVQRQGPDQGRPLGRLCHPLSRQEHRRRRHGAALHDPAFLRDRHRRAAVALCRPARHRDRTASPPPGSRTCCRSWCA